MSIKKKKRRFDFVLAGTVLFVVLAVLFSELNARERSDYDYQQQVLDSTYAIETELGGVDVDLEFKRHENVRVRLGDQDSTVLDINDQNGNRWISIKGLGTFRMSK